MKLPIFKVNHTHHKSAFFFNAFYSAVIFAVVFVVNDHIDEYINEKKFKTHHHKYIKLLIHFTTTFILTFLVICVFWILFGWGDTFLA
jgi:hypothetical protein